MPTALSPDKEKGGVVAKSLKTGLASWSAFGIS